MRLVLSVDVGYRNLAKVLGSVTSRNGIVHVKIESAEVTDVLHGSQVVSIAKTATRVVQNLDSWLDNADEMVCESQVRKSGMNFGLAHAILGAAAAKQVPCTFMPAKAKFEAMDGSAETNLKKRAIQSVTWMLANESARLDLKNFMQPFTRARKKDDLADALLQLLTHVKFEHECRAGNPKTERSPGRVGTTIGDIALLIKQANDGKV